MLFSTAGSETACFADVLYDVCVELTFSDGILILQAWASEECFEGGDARYFSKIFLWGPKVVKIIFSHSKLRKQPFLLKCSNARERQGPTFDPCDY